MALVLKDRVKEQTTTTGTGTVTLGGALSGFDTFASVGNGNTTYYAIVHQTADEWEVGIGTYTAVGTLLSRDTILESSNSDAAVVFSAGTKDVFVTYPADKSVYYDSGGTVIIDRLRLVAGVTVTSILDEDNMASNSAIALSTQQSIKAYVDAQVGTADTLSEVLALGNTTGGTDIAMTGGDKITNFESTGINDDAVSTALTIDANGDMLQSGGGIKVSGSLSSATTNSISLDQAGAVSRVRTFGPSVGNAVTIQFEQADSAGTPIRYPLVINSSGNVGIGSTSPSQKLEVAGNILATGGSISIGTGGLYQAGSIYSDASWGMIFRAKQASPGAADFMWADSANVERMRINSAGNVGIGTSSPSNVLTVSSATQYKGFTLTNGTNTVAELLGFAAGNDTGGLKLYTAGVAKAEVQAAGFTYFNGGNVGIGTSVPAHELDVLGASDPIIRVRATGSGTGDDSLIRMAVTNASASNYIQFGDNSDSDAGYIRYAHSNDSLYFATNAAVRMIINSSGNVGIGTTSPSQKLAVGGSASGTVALQVTNSTAGTAFNNGMQMFINDTAGGLNMREAYPLQFYVNGSERIRIDSTGNVGIGTSSPAEKLDVNGNIKTNAIFSDKPADFWSASASYFGVDTLGSLTTQGSYEVALTANGYRGAGALWVSQNNNSQTGATQITLNPAGYMSFRTEAVKATGAGTTVTERMRITSAGRVGIGTTAPATTLDVTGGTIRTNKIEGGYNNASGNFHIDSKVSTAGSVYLNWFQGTGGVRCGNGASGYGIAYAAEFQAVSDRRLKENISYFDSGLAKILQLKPATFDFINGENNQKGFIAQDVETVIPEVVRTTTMSDSNGNVDETDTYLTINSSAIIPYLVAAVQEQQGIIQEQQTIIESFETRLAALEA
ncbi:tail fiber domain-containing protein [Flavobacteriales bacterium]|nr:tail fiber domain-containing protein [Flavobacteriales bacterium]